MPNRIIKESIWTSPNLNQLSDLAERHFYRILVLPDDFGCCEVTPLVVKGRCYPLRPNISENEIDVWQAELEEKGLIIRWATGGRQYAVFPSFAKHQRIRSLHQRKTPTPPNDVLLQLDGDCQQLSSTDRLNPNPILNHNHNHTPLLSPQQLPSINLSIETEENVLDVYKKSITLTEELSEDMENELRLATERFSARWIIDAIKVACEMDSYENPTRTWRYITGILKKWKRFGKGKR